MCISQSHQLYRYTFLEGSGTLAGTFLMRLNFHVLEYYAEFKGIKIVAGFAILVIYLLCAVTRLTVPVI